MKIKLANGKIWHVDRFIKNLLTLALIVFIGWFAISLIEVWVRVGNFDNNNFSWNFFTYFINLGMRLN